MTKSRPLLQSVLMSYSLEDVELIYSNAKHNAGVMQAYDEFTRYRLRVAALAELRRRGVDAQSHPTLFDDCV